MDTIFDTLAFSKHLINQGGFSSRQAEAMAEAVRHASTRKADRVELKDLVVKDDLYALRDDMYRDFTSVRKEASDLRDDMNREFTAVRKEISDLRDDMNREFASVRDDMNREFTAVRKEISDLRDDMNREFVSVRATIAHEIELSRKETADLRQNMNEEFTKVHKLIADQSIAFKEQNSSLIRWVIGICIGLGAFLSALIVGLFSILPSYLQHLANTP